MTKIAQLNSKAFQAQNKYLAEKDAAKKKELQRNRMTRRGTEYKKSPALYREVVEKHATVRGVRRGDNTSSRRARNRLTADEAAKLVKIVQDQAVPFGPLFAATTLAPIADVLTRQPGLEAVALCAIESVANAITDDQPASLQSIVLSSYQNAR